MQLVMEYAGECVLADDLLRREAAYAGAARACGWVSAQGDELSPKQRPPTQVPRRTAPPRGCRAGATMH